MKLYLDKKSCRCVGIFEGHQKPFNLAILSLFLWFLRLDFVSVSMIFTIRFCLCFYDFYDYILELFWLCVFFFFYNINCSITKNVLLSFLFLKYFSLGLVGQVKNDLFPIIKQSLLSNGSLDSEKNNSWLFFPWGPIKKNLLSFLIYDPLKKTWTFYRVILWNLSTQNLLQSLAPTCVFLVDRCSIHTGYFCTDFPKLGLYLKFGLYMIPVFSG
jgi:hypothetical protein